MVRALISFYVFFWGGRESSLSNAYFFVETKRLRDPYRGPLPQGSSVVPLWVCYGFWIRDSKMVRKKELHKSVWISMGFISCMARTRECCWLEGVRVYGLRVYGFRQCGAS